MWRCTAQGLILSLRAISSLLIPSPAYSMIFCSRAVSFTSFSCQPHCCCFVRHVRQSGKRASPEGAQAERVHRPATALIVARTSSRVASLLINPHAPAFTNASMSSCTGNKSMTIIMCPDVSRLRFSVTRRLSCRHAGSHPAESHCFCIQQVTPQYAQRRQPLLLR